MFKYRLTRLPYFISLLIYEIWLLIMLDSDKDINLVIAVVSLPFSLIFIVLPRVRDCGWPQWVGFLTLIPYLGSLPGIALLFARSKVFGRSDRGDLLAEETGDKVESDHSHEKQPIGFQVSDINEK